MQKDQAIEEIRAVRHKISNQFGHNTKALLDHYKELEKRYADRILARPYHIKKKALVREGGKTERSSFLTK